LKTRQLTLLVSLDEKRNLGPPAAGGLTQPAASALSVLLFHILESTTSDVAHNPFRHAHLAVDFFFALSGFVLAHAYDGRPPGLCSRNI